ncbi:MAG: hypothetical protein KIT09_34910 [Bryobacteraceae bacterium]|nr:hypothetical protein [Bryobacteraceae bacterium]
MPSARSVACCLTLLALAACRPSEPPPVATVEEPEDLLTMVHVADPKAAQQLIKGFHELEQNAWRWAMKEFSVSLKPPPGALERGAVVRLNFTLPGAIAQKLGPMTLIARIGDESFAPETYSKEGDYVYAREVPAGKIGGDAVVIDFQFDKALPPGELDQRELSVIVTSAGFEAR